MGSVRRVVSSVVVAGVFAAATTSADAEAPVSVTAPIQCSRGPASQTFSAALTMPRSWTSGSVFRVRIDGVSSGTISHGGLNYIHGMRTNYLVPTGSKVMPGSVHVVAGTGTANARDGARAWSDASGIHLELPAHVDNGTSFTPPTLEFDLRVDAPPGTVLPLQLARYEVTANVFLLGDLLSTCEPNPHPFTLAQTVVVAPAPPPPFAPTPAPAAPAPSPTPRAPSP